MSSIMHRSSATKYLTSIMFALSLSGCATYYGATRIQSVPSGAQVIDMEDGSIVGVTPTLYLRKDNSDLRQTIIIRFKKDGYYDKTSSFWMEMRLTSAEDAKKNSALVEIELQDKG